MNYYKLNDGVLCKMPAPKHVSNPTEAMLAEYAAEHGYQPLITTTAPSAYHEESWIEGADAITQAWVEPELESLKLTLSAEAEAAKEVALQETATLEVEGVGSVIYNQQAAINIISLIIKQKGATYIMADDSAKELSVTDITAISDTFEAHVADIYLCKTAALAAIAAAETVEELLAL